MAGVTIEARPAPLSVSDLRLRSGRRRREGFVRRAFFGAALVSVLINALIVVTLFDGTWDFLSRVDLGLLWTDGWFPRRDMYDVKTIVAGTMVVSVVAMVVATPLGLGAAIYLAEYASRRSRRWLKPILEVLAGIPSVVMGFFALTVISPNLMQRFFDAGLFSLGAAGIGVGILITPLVASVAEDAMFAVPSSLREASYGLGARKRATTIRVVFPAAVSGIVAAMILGISRAIGETLVVAIAAGATGGSLFTLDPREPGQTMTAAMTAIATGSDQVKGAALAFPSLFFVGALLFFMTLALNVMSERFVRRVRRRY
ncbi:MAG TPA: phosphate ABC transporter permease subunit PstC [Actinomycetota bacterium]|nr:phosphate ABC transporter permease subunit PstC [Actinomycetota bacterium]